MKWLAVFLLLAMPALAQEIELQNLAIGVQCRPISPEAILEEQFGELPMLEGNAIVLGNGQQVLPGDMAMYVNPETKSYTIGFSVDNELFCVVMTGSNLGPAVQGNKL
jgi:hypothetical protein